MKAIFTITFLALSFASCKKESFEQPPPITITVNAFNVCAVTDSIFCLGDSFTWGVIGTKYPDHLAYLLGKTELSVLNAGRPGLGSTQIADDYITHPNRQNFAKWLTVIWIGRNNAEDTAQINRDIDRITAAYPRYLLLEIITGNFVSEQKGTPFYEKVAAFNERMAIKHSRHYVSLKPFLAQFQDGSAFDSLCVARGGFPQSLAVPGDSLHFAGTANMHVAERIVMQLDPCLNPAQ